MLTNTVIWTNMASGFFAILDDIAALMDDVAVTSKLATKKLPPYWAMIWRWMPKNQPGSYLPESYLYCGQLPKALFLLLGGFYLAYEGLEKVIENFFHKKQPAHEAAEKIIQEDAA